MNNTKNHILILPYYYFPVTGNPSRYPSIHRYPIALHELEQLLHAVCLVYTVEQGSHPLRSFKTFNDFSGEHDYVLPLECKVNNLQARHSSSSPAALSPAAI